MFVFQNLKWRKPHGGRWHTTNLLKVLTEKKGSSELWVVILLYEKKEIIKPLEILTYYYQTFINYAQK